MKICEVTGRVHRNRRELAAELARIDAQLAALRAIEAQYAAAFLPGDGPVFEPVYDAWNAVYGAIDALEHERVRVEMNPRPIPAGEAGTWALVQQNID